MSTQPCTVLWTKGKNRDKKCACKRHPNIRTYVQCQPMHCWTMNKERKEKNCERDLNRNPNVGSRQINFRWKHSSKLMFTVHWTSNIFIHTKFIKWNVLCEAVECKCIEFACDQTKSLLVVTTTTFIQYIFSFFSLPCIILFKNEAYLAFSSLSVPLTLFLYLLHRNCWLVHHCGCMFRCTDAIVIKHLLLSTQ